MNSRPIIKQLQGNTWKYALLLIANKRVFVAILGAYYLTIPDVTAKGIGIILLAGSLSGFIFEIPSGYISDKIGHKQAIVISRLLILFSTILFLIAEDISFLIIAGISLSVGHAFHSGTGSAFMHETLKGLGREGDYARVMGKISSIGFAVPVIFMTLIPFLVSISFKFPFIIALVVDVVGLAAALALVTPPVPQEEVKEIGVTNFRQVIQEGYRLNFFTFALFSGIVSGFLLSVGGFRAPYQVFLEVPVIWYGIFFGTGRAVASLMLAYTGRIKESTTIYSFYKFKLILYAVLILLLGVLSIDWVIIPVFIVINAFQWGLSRVNNSYLMDIISTSKFKATLLSTHAQIGNIITAVTSFGLGFIIERVSYQYGFLMLGIGFIVVTVPLLIYIFKQRNAGVYAAFL